MAGYPHHYEITVEVLASLAELFESIDDHERLAGHMMNSSMMMGGSRMRFSTDEAGGKAVGLKIRMAGTVLGFTIELEEVVTDREPLRRKSWETVGEPRLLLIGGYRMGFEIMPTPDGSRLKVSIDWRDPPPTWRWLGALLGRSYARWCTKSMARGTAASFSRTAALAAAAP